MQTQAEQQPHTSILKRILAGFVLVVAVALAFKLVIGMITAVFWVVVAVAVAIAILWALKTLIW
jgi:hypothetical protein